MHLLDGFHWGGAQRVALDLIRYSVDRGFAVTVLGRDGPMRAAFDDLHGVSVVSLPEASRSGVLGQIAAVRAAVRARRPALLHAHQRREALIANMVARPLRIPTVEHAHTVLPSLGFARLSFRSDRVLAVSEGVRAMVDRAGAGDRVRLVGNTASRVDVSPSRGWTQPGRDEPLRLLGIGRLEPQKDPLRFVRVAAAIADQRPVQAMWLGNGPLRQTAVDAAVAAGVSVAFPGQSDAVVSALDDAHALVMTSRWEGLPLVLLESFARRRPVYATHACDGDGALADGRAVSIPDDASDQEFARTILHDLDRFDMEDRLERAAAYAAAQTPDVVFGRVLAAYRALGVDAA